MTCVIGIEFFKKSVRSNIKSRENHNGFPALFFYPNGERRLAKWTDIRT